MTPPDRTEMLLIRHAPADHGGRLCGRRDVPARIAEGPALTALRTWLSACSEVVTSPALRCRQTAGALFPGRPLASDPALWEQDFGDHDGLRFEEIPDLGKLSQDELSTYRPPGGESFAEMAARLRPVLTALSRRAQAGGPLAVVAHAGTVRAALGIALGQIPAGLGFEVAPLSVTRLRCFGDGFSVAGVNWPGPAT
ncbi:histidine phosphatase family protein [Salipiger sp. P9]|uniref:histidine phosphatase family protein n=1 Tax=Salipiger pentaromativorans TaxID=2943193 RepID=UPI0021581F78|nr:histidine phosphatase family protein [Salipiger pentaromativorans]MCR8549008.1 histidine phosphatase family protein [Salipiger pentaromativorans]